MTNNNDVKTSVELLPCPFCGYTAESFEVDRRGGIPYYGVQCTNPNCKVQPLTDVDCRTPDGQAAIAAWNTRAALASRPAVDDEVRKCIEFYATDGNFSNYHGALAEATPDKTKATVRGEYARNVLRILPITKGNTHADD